MKPIEPISFQQIEEAQKRIAGLIVRTPMIRLHLDSNPCEIYLKLENLQPIGSFKIRGSANAMLLANPEELKRGVITASAGNMALGVAWNAKRMGVASTVVAPDHAPEAKLQPVRKLDAKIIKIPFSEWWSVLQTHRYDSLDGFFIHPVCNRNVIAGNGTIGLEILEDLPDVDSVLIPYGGGGLSCGIASAVKAKKPSVKIFGCEVETATPLSASFSAGKPMEVSYTPSFVDGIGGKSVLPEMWPLVHQLMEGSIVVSLQQIASCIRTLAEKSHVIAEGAGAASLAAALTGKAGNGKIVCVISGGNINPDVLTKILTNPEQSFSV